MADYLPVRERVMRALVTHLSGITRANGYVVDVRHVRRRRDIVEEDAEDPPEIHLVFGVSQSTARGTEDRWTEVPASLLFYLRCEEGEEDTQYNFMLADIQRRLRMPIEDTSAVPYGGNSRLIEIESGWDDEPLYYLGRGGDVIGRVDFSILYSWKIDDPRLWDASDVLVAA